MSSHTPFRTIVSRYVAIPRDNIDTDQIIPARFLTTTRRDGLGEFAFAGWRYRADGSPDPGFALNQPDASDAEILVAGRNFGCGSSREHAVWALRDAGFRAVISEDFGDIFRANALGNGLLPVAVPAAIAAALLAQPPGPGAELIVSLEHRTLTLPGGDVAPFPVPEFARHCLLHGIDELDFLLDQAPAIALYEQMNRGGPLTFLRPT